MICSLEVGGAERLLVNYIQANSRLQAPENLTVAIINDRIDDGLLALLQGHCRLELLRRPQGHKHPKYLRQLLRIVREQDIQVVHTHDFGSKYWAMLIKLFVPKIKLVFTSHATEYVKNFSPVDAFFHRNFINCTIAISRAVQQECVEKRILRVRQIYNGIPLNEHHYRPRRLDRSKSTGIINVARIVPAIKGQEVLIEAVSLARARGYDVYAVFAGDIAGAYQPAYQQLLALAERLGVAEHVRFLGYTEHVAQALDSCDIFCLCSHQEGLGLVIIEGMASGLPVLCSGVSGPDELVEHERTGLIFEPGSPQSLADAIVHFLERPEQALAMAERAHEFVKRFHIDDMAREYHALYRELLSPGGAGR